MIAPIAGSPDDPASILREKLEEVESKTVTPLHDRISRACEAASEVVRDFRRSREESKTFRRARLTPPPA